MNETKEAETTEEILDNIWTPETIHGFSESVLRRNYDNPVTTPKFHLEMWGLCTSKHPQIAIAAPRNHSKSTAITHAYVLAAALFQIHQYIIIVSDTEEQASEFLGDIKNELRENEDLIRLFGVKKIIKDAVTDVIVQMSDGYLFRIIAKGAEQKLRGRKWKGKRPSLILCHACNTDIYTPETGWIKNQDYPNAKIIHSDVAYEIKFEDGTKEVVSGDHRYFVEGYGWLHPYQMKKGDYVADNGIKPIKRSILSALKHLVRNIMTSLK